MARSRRRGTPPESLPATDEAVGEATAAPGAGSKGPRRRAGRAEPRPTAGEQSRAGPAPLRPAVHHPPLSERPVVRAGVYAWAIIGLVLVLIAAGLVLGRLRLVWVPLAVALFPAALLAPLNLRLRRREVPRALASVICVLGLVGVVVGAVLVLAPVVVAEIPGLRESIAQGVAQVDAFLETRPFGLEPERVRDTVASAQRQIIESDVVRTGLLGAAGAAAEILAMTVLMLVVLFFYLKDGDRIAAWARDIFPHRVRDDVQIMGMRAWTTIGSYFRGQLFVALVDGVFIGLGVFFLGVPLALPIGVLVFFGGLFPIVGAVATGAVAVLVALADSGPIIALAVLGVVIAVQQLESNILGPMVLGKAVQLHPLAVITALTAGGILLGVLGAFIAVPVAASVMRAVSHVRSRVPG